MGLDMYAVRRTYVKGPPSEPAEEQIEVQVTRGGEPVPGLKPERINCIDEQVMYWRKANQIHGWFVRNVQEGNDDCREYLIWWDKLKKLLSDCKEVLEASTLISGSVYAGTVYDKEHPQGIVQRVPGKVIQDSTVAAKILPRCQGAFFGQYEYDEDYLTEVRDTARWAASMLQDHSGGNSGNIIYRSSW